jgi:hypothetical protein
MTYEMSANVQIFGHSFTIVYGSSHQKLSMAGVMLLNKLVPPSEPNEYFDLPTNKM